ncbi:MAG: RluA family pseudouridine synthase [Planctomycetota bacterium]|nr:MAG: RluA family pseudouridine synthase [Planctomycetota bacterium]
MMAPPFVGGFTTSYLDRLCAMRSPPFDILFESDWCLVVNKPYGLLTQGPPLVPSLDKEVRVFLKRREGKVGQVYLGVPHRLDRPVSGAIVFGKHRRATRRLTECFQGRLIRKVYWACTEGEVTPPEGVWRDFMRKIPDQPQAEIVPPDHPDAKSAVLRYRTLGRTRYGSWLEIELETGRMHQIRLQAASRGRPIVGDRQYGATTTFGEKQEDWRLEPIALHARLLAFPEPQTMEPLEIVAPLPEVWQTLLPGID